MHFWYSAYYELTASTCFKHYLLIFRRRCTNNTWYITCVLCLLASPVVSGTPILVKPTYTTHTRYQVEAIINKKLKVYLVGFTVLIYYNARSTEHKVYWHCKHASNSNQVYNTSGLSAVTFYANMKQWDTKKNFNTFSLYVKSLK
jgi:hypothetical protein